MVINDDLMGNYPLELAYQISNYGHLYNCNCRFLPAATVIQVTIIRELIG